MTDQTIPPSSRYGMDFPSAEEMQRQRAAELRRQAGERLIRAVCVAQVARKAAGE